MPGICCSGRIVIGYSNLIGIATSLICHRPLKNINTRRCTCKCCFRVVNIIKRASRRATCLRPCSGTCCSSIGIHCKSGFVALLLIGSCISHAGRVIKSYMHGIDGGTSGFRDGINKSILAYN